MEQHASIALPQPEIGDSGYFYAVLRYGLTRGLLDDGDVSALQLGLYTLLSEETERYTMGESSSVTVETAQSLYRSACFCIGLRLQQAGGLAEAAALLKEESLSFLFLAGRALVRVEIARGRALLSALEEAGFRTGNLAYLATQTDALPQFFRRYDFFHATHDIPCMIDYPLSLPVTGEGILYINAYLEQLLFETRFLAAFDPNTVARLLRGHCPEPDEAVINLFAPVYHNAMGRALLKKEIRPLNLRPIDRKALWQLLEGCAEEALSLLLRQAEERLLQELYQDAPQRVFFETARQELFSRLLLQKTEDGLAGIFTAFPAPEPKTVMRYQKRKPMTDEALRTLIEELREMRFLSDKLSLFQHEVRAFADWLEIVPLCFSEEELPEVFDLLSDEAVALLLRHLNSCRETPDWEPAPWVQTLLQYVDALEPARKNQIRLLVQADWNVEPNLLR